MFYNHLNHTIQHSIGLIIMSHAGIWIILTDIVSGLCAYNCIYSYCDIALLHSYKVHLIKLHYITMEFTERTHLRLRRVNSSKALIRYSFKAAKSFVQEREMFYWLEREVLLTNNSLKKFYHCYMKLLISCVLTDCFVTWEIWSNSFLSFTQISTKSCKSCS